MGEENPRERILDAAEQLFAEQGISGTSLRELTRTANVNLASVHYYFGSKDALLDAVIERRAEPVNERRQRALAGLQSGGRCPEVEAILEAYFRPAVTAIPASGERQRLGRLVARIEAQPPQLVEGLFRKHFGEVSSQFVDALHRALPHLRSALVADRFRYAAGLFSFLFSGNFDLDTLPGHEREPQSLEDELTSAVGFLAAGIRAKDPLADAGANSEVAA